MLKHSVAVAIRLAFAELKTDASRAYLGLIWWFLEPTFYLAVFYFVFAVGLRMGGDDFAAFLLTGLVPWRWISSTIQGGAVAIQSNAGLIRQLDFQKWILPLSVVIANTLRFFLVLAFLCLLLVMLGDFQLVTFWTVLPVFICALVFVSGCALLAAGLVPFLPELRLVVENLLLVMFFASGIFYEFDSNSEAAQWMWWNPFAGVIEGYRYALMGGADGLDLQRLAFVAGCGLCLGVAGLWNLKRHNKQFAKLV